MNPEIDVIRELLEKAINTFDEYHPEHWPKSQNAYRCNNPVYCKWLINKALSLLPPECETCGDEKEVCLNCGGNRKTCRCDEQTKHTSPARFIPCPDYQSQWPISREYPASVEDSWVSESESQEPAKQTETEFKKEIETWLLDWESHTYRDYTKKIRQICDRLEAETAAREKAEEDAESEKQQILKQWDSEIRSCKEYADKMREEIMQLQAKVKRREKALQYCREYWGECDGIHDCTGKSCVICNINKALSG